MTKFRLPIQRSVMLIGIAVAITAVIAGFIGVSHVNGKQKFASAEPTTQAAPTPQLSAGDVKPIVDTTSIDSAARQLSALDTELGPDQCVSNLITDVESIAN